MLDHARSSVRSRVIRSCSPQFFSSKRQSVKRATRFAVLKATLVDDISDSSHACSPSLSGATEGPRVRCSVYVRKRGPSVAPLSEVMSDCHVLLLRCPIEQRRDVEGRLQLDRSMLAR